MRDGWWLKKVFDFKGDSCFDVCSLIGTVALHGNIDLTSDRLCGNESLKISTFPMM